MHRIRRNIIVDEYLKNTTIHGLFYLNKEINTKQKTLWLSVVICSITAIIASTVLLTFKYFQFANYIVVNENELNELETLPNILFCEHEKQAMIDAISFVLPELGQNAQIIRSNTLNLPNESAFIPLFIVNLHSKLNNTIANNTFNFKFINNTKYTYIDKKQPFILLNCNIELKNDLYDCMQSIEILFNFNGICMQLNFKKLLNSLNNSLLLSKSYSSLSYMDDYKISLKLNVLSKKLDYVFISLANKERTESNNLNNNEIPYSIKNTNLLTLTEKDFNSYYVVNSVRKLYSNGLHSQKCFQNYDEMECHFECLIRLIADLLKCHFTLTDDTKPDLLPFCTLNDLIIIEELIIKNYYQLRSFMGCSKTKFLN